ncbi:hypothetical protein [uncultured Ferrimonas sp.]|uniref:hypothetical protein n=1 Tax=uncultured Ferrimonas sp. TaxID=432640 RepID=UPI00261C51BC|nr:hypothetical protein [uncultured Ferrimonas sp.]
MTAQLNQFRILLSRASAALSFNAGKKHPEQQLSDLPDHVLRDIGFNCEGRCPRGEHIH